MVTDRGEQAVASVRLRIENRQITEGEWHIAHKGDPGISGQGSDVLFDVEKLIASPPPQRAVPQADRLPRDTLVRIVNTYFDGLVAGNGRTVLAHGGCSRFENGFEVTGRPIRSGDLTDGFQGLGDCTSGYCSLAVALVAARRYLLIDEEAQAVVMSAVFVRKPGDERRPNHFMEVFGIDGGRIRTVHAAMFYAAPDVPLPNWAPYEGNFPWCRIRSRPSNRRCSQRPRRRPTDAIGPPIARATSAEIDREIMQRGRQFCRPGVGCAEPFREPLRGDVGRIDRVDDSRPPERLEGPPDRGFRAS